MAGVIRSLCRGSARCNKEEEMDVLTQSEIGQVAGGDLKGALGAGAAALAVGGASLGAEWGAVAVGVAIGAAPLTVVALVGLAAYAGYELMQN
ncbi:hypothetical protein ASD55_14435 [Rhodanobacter sp. Root561]|nr:hypothetical protein ASD55_14435 [Rhodanobacter sp. Root561]